MEKVNEDKVNWTMMAISIAALMWFFGVRPSNFRNALLETLKQFDTTLNKIIGQD